MLPSARDVLGPIMVGPSSSHTAGALRIGRMAAEMLPGPLASASTTLYNSFALTAEGHGTTRALIAGVLGMDADDPRIRDSAAIAAERGLAVSIAKVPEAPGLHPNTADVALTATDGRSLTCRGESLGGGRVRLSAIDGVPVEVSGDLPTLFVRHVDAQGVLARLCGAVAAAQVNIATIRTSREAPGRDAFTVMESDQPIPQELLDALAEDREVVFASAVYVPGEGLEDVGAVEGDFASAAELLALCDALPGSVGSVMRRREMAIVGADPIADVGATVDAWMGRVMATMGEAVRDTIASPRASMGGFLFGEARMVWDKQRSLAALSGTLEARAAAYAMATVERSSSMGVIVAAPTAGASGIVPGTLIALAEALAGAAAGEEPCPEAPRDLPRLESALWCAAAVGALAQGNASVSGAEAGCQAETGVAAAMAAAGVCQMLFGSPEVCLNAAAIALANVEGLVCDPALGLVEYPCQLRNAQGVATALMAARLSLAGVRSPVGLDEALAALYAVGQAMPRSLRETAGGGLARCPSILARQGCASCESAIES